MSDGERAPFGGPLGPRLRLGGGMGVDPDAIARAEAALKSLSSNFETWMSDEIVKLEAARARVDVEGWITSTAEDLYMRAHDLKGLGTTYQYPIVTRLAGSLCKLIGDPARRLAAPLALVDAHIAAIKRSVAQQIHTEDDPWAAAAAADLEARASAAAA